MKGMVNSALTVQEENILKREEDHHRNLEATTIIIIVWNWKKKTQQKGLEVMNQT